MRSLLASLLCFLLFSFVAVNAQSNLTPTNIADLLEAEEVALPTAAEDVVTSFVFPDNPSKQLIAGEPTEVLVGFRNKGSRQYNITFIDASFNYPLDQTFFIQNFSRWEYGMPVQPNQEVALAYAFRPDAMLEPRDFALVVNIYYKDSTGRNYTSAAYNGTIDLIEPSGGWDAQSFFAILAVLALLGVGGFFAYRSVSSWALQKTAKKAEYGTKVRQEVEDDWLAGTAADPAPSVSSRQRAGRKRCKNTVIPIGALRSCVVACHVVRKDAGTRRIWCTSHARPQNHNHLCTKLSK
jgi:translocon-associated protein subunit alpha